VSSVASPHPWLGLDYRDLLPGLALGQHRFTISLTRPNGYCYGSGALRVVCVRGGEPSWHCVLAYERYHSGPRRPGGPSDNSSTS
jgi:hypothetical protein